ncbi:MAG: YggS family pyridoxal phosphate-dependent enzyme [Actinomycetota bacterium]
MSGTVADRFAAVRARLAAAAGAVGRDPASVTLVAVSKTAPVEAIREAVAAGATDLGENRAQELLAKAPALAAGGPPVRWHFIGRLQRNKVRQLAPLVAVWQSVDRPELVDEIARFAPGATVLVQVNIDREVQKGGCDPDLAGELVARARDAGLAVRGLMAVPAADRAPLPAFRRVRQMVEEFGLSECSIGMSGDLEAAVAAGSTMVRIGTAVFGERPPAGAPRG